MKVLRKVLCILMVLSFGILFGCKEKAQYVEVNPNNYDLLLTEVVVEIPGVEDDDVYLFMTDNQANFDTNREDLGWFGSSATRVFCDDNGVNSADNFDNWIRYANESKVDAVLMGGDIIDFYSEENITVLHSKISELNVPYLYTYGNHDSYVPWEHEFADDEVDFLDLFANKNSELQVLDQGEYLIVSIRNYQVDGTAQISVAALEEFKAIYEQDKPIILICHVPIYTEHADGLYEIATETSGVAFMQYDAGEYGIVNKSTLMGSNCGYDLTESTEQFLELVLNENSPVVAVLSGHLHKQWEGYISDDIYEYVGPGAFMNKGILLYVSQKGE